MTLSSATRAALAAAFVLAAGPAFADEAVELITAEEAGLPPAAAEGTTARNITRGPGVDGVAPSTVGVTGTFRFAVKFKPRNGVEIDPQAVTVTYLREPPVDLTARLRDFISAEGIEAPAVVVPPGEHVIAIEAVDQQGRTGRGQMVLTVNP